MVHCQFFNFFRCFEKFDKRSVPLSKCAFLDHLAVVLPIKFGQACQTQLVFSAFRRSAMRRRGTTLENAKSRQAGSRRCEQKTDSRPFLLITSFSCARRARIKRTPLADWKQNNWIGISFFGNALRALRSRIQRSELGRRLFRGRYRLRRGRRRFGWGSCRGAVFVVNHFSANKNFCFSAKNGRFWRKNFNFRCLPAKGRVRPSRKTQLSRAVLIVS